MNVDDLDERNEIDLINRILHLGLALFGLLALTTGNFADDFKVAGGLGFGIHRWVGMGVAFFISLRVAYGVWGPARARFSNWVPYNPERFRLIIEDLRGLANLRLPDRRPRQGVAALVEASGLLLVFFLAVTGALLFFAIEPGHKVQGSVRLIKEFHEVGELLLPLFLLGHGGADFLHALAGNHLWRKMVFLKEKEDSLRRDG